MKRLTLNSLVCVTLCCSLASADHKPPVTPIRFGADHSHEDHSGLVHGPYGASTQRANLSFTNFSDATFRNSLREVNLTGAVFDRATMTNTWAEQATIVDASFRGARWSLGRIGDTQIVRTNFGSAELTNNYFFDLQMEGSSFRGVDFRLSLFDNVDFGDADLSGAQLGGADLTGAHLDRAQFSGDTTYDRYTRFPDDFDPTSAGLQLVEPVVLDQLGDMTFHGLVNSFVLPDYYYGVAVDPKSDSLLMLAFGDRFTRSFERRSIDGALMETIELPVPELDALDFTPEGNWILGSENTEQIAVYDPSTKAIVAEGKYNFDEFEGWAYHAHRNTVFGTEDDGHLFELDFEGNVIDCCFTTAEHENLGYYHAVRSLVAVDENLDFLSPKGEVHKSMPLVTLPLDENANIVEWLGDVRSIDIDEANELLYALYPTDGFTTVRVFDLRAVPEPSLGCGWCISVFAIAIARFRTQFRAQFST